MPTVDGFRLAPQQKHVWTLQQSDTTTPYRVQGVLQLTGPLDNAAFKTALQNIVDRSEI